MDSRSALEIVRLIHREDRKIAAAVRPHLPAIAGAVEMIREALARGGRLIYVGAGSSGRLGVLDAAECPPTFGVPPGTVQGIIAGGKRALWRSQEGAEDDGPAGARAMERARVGGKDVVCGITASGRTPFVRGALAEAGRRGARTILICCHPSPALKPLAGTVINPLVGPEVISGSTRLKAGTATKMILNMLSTGAMIRLGRAYGDHMVDLRPGSAKLRERAEGMIVSILGCSGRRARRLLQASGDRVKVAVVMGAKGCDRRRAEGLLREKQGWLGEVLKNG